MVQLYLLIAIAAVALAYGLAVVCFEQGKSIARLAAEKAQLYRDNQRLTEAICRANGQFVELNDLSTAHTPPAQKRTAPAPYFKSKEPRQVAVGEKTVTL